MSLELNLIFMVSYLLSAGLNPLMLKNTFLASCQSYLCYCSITLTKKNTTCGGLCFYYFQQKFQKITKANNTMILQTS